MASTHKGYEELLNLVLTNGDYKSDRTGTGTKSLPGLQLRYNLNGRFPLITTKFVPLRIVAKELLWFLRGETNVRSLQEEGVTIWDEWADKETGDLGPIYGKQWRDWVTPDGRHVDQIQVALDMLRNKPDSRRIIVSAWNPADLPDESLSPHENVKNGKMALAPCHAFFQFTVSGGRLNCMVTQRSADMFLGVPFNIASYALLTHMMAQQANLGVGSLIWTGNDCHIYSNHFEQVKEQLRRDPYCFPKLELHKAPSLTEYTVGHLNLTGYQHHPHIKGDVAV